MSRIMHGGRLDAIMQEHGGTREQWLDLSTGINPRAYPVGDVSQQAWSRLPDSEALDALLSSARDYYGISGKAEIVPANGTQALIQVLPNVLNCRRVAILEPTYGEHELCWRKSGCEVEAVIDPVAGETQAEVVVIGNPNNPDGRIFEPNCLIDLSADLHDRSGVLVVDEAFCDLHPELSLLNRLPENAVVLRSFGKFFGLAGLRLGFAVCHPGLSGKLLSALGPWSVSGPALEIGARALQDKKWIGQTRQWIADQCRAMEKVLLDAGFDITGNGGLFLEVRHPNAGTIYSALLVRKILVRPFPERPGFLRFGLCADGEQLERLRAELGQIVREVS